MKSEGVKDVVKWLEEECKNAKEDVQIAKKAREGADYWGHDYYDNMISIEEAKLSTLVKVKISTEKYMKKLRHEGQ